MKPSKYRVAKKVKLSEVSFVGDPANTESTVALFKGKYRMEEENNPQDLEKTMEEMAEKMAEMEMSAKAMEDMIKECGMQIVDGKLVKMEDEEEYMEVDGEKIAKSSIPSPLLKALEAKDEELRKAREEKETADLHARVEATLAHLPGTVETRAKLLKSADADAELLAILQAADEVFSKSFKEEGRSASESDMSSPEDKLDELVKSYMDNKKVSFYKAYEAVTKTPEGRSLLNMKG